MSYVIYVPKADLTLIQASPEIRELDVNQFRLDLKAWEDDDEGMVQPRTNDHNTEVTLAGLTYARIVEVLAPYTIEFEDGQYSVNCTGANHNISDVKVVNQVSLIVNNAAGLVTNTAIEYSSYNDVVVIDPAGDTVGTLFPKGTGINPVNNLADAKLIAQYRGFDSLYIHGDITFEASDDIDGYKIYGQSVSKTAVTVTSGCSTTGSEFYDCTITGILDGSATAIKNCEIDTLSGFNGYIHDSVFLAATTTLAGSGDCHFIDCRSGVAGIGTCTIDMGGSGRNLGVRGWIGGIKITNLTSAQNVSLDFVAGSANIDSTVTAGTIVIRGQDVIKTLNQGGSVTVVEPPDDPANIRGFILATAD